MQTTSDKHGPDAATGTALIAGKFRLVELIAKDPSFSLYRAERVADFPQTVAMRLPGDDAAQTSTVLLERLRTLQRMLAPLHHPGIAALVDVSLDPASPWLAAEFVDGLPLDLYCARQPLTFRQKVQVFAAALDAVAYAHRHLTVHGALSFAHIRVDSAGTPHLVSFNAGSSSHTQPPSEPLTTATDVRDAGRLLFELLTGKPPLQPAARPSSLVKGALRRQLRGDLDAILLRALAPEPAARYADAGAFAADLNRYLTALPVEARRGGLFYRSGKFARRNRLIAAALALLAFIVAGSGAVVVEQNLQAARARAQAQTRLADMQRLTDSLLVQLSADLERLPGAEPVQAVVLQQISMTLGSMAQEAGSERQFRENLAQEYLLLARLLERHPQHGLTAASEAKRGLAVLQPLLAAQPSARARQLEAGLHNIR